LLKFFYEFDVRWWLGGSHVEKETLDLCFQNEGAIRDFVDPRDSKELYISRDCFSWET
jgi:hypothetical protein